MEFNETLYEPHVEKAHYTSMFFVFSAVRVSVVSSSSLVKIHGNLGN
jgi:hypothetical protein